MKTRLDQSAGRRANCPEMRSWPLGQAIRLAVLCLAVWAVGPRAVAQTPAGIDIQMYAGLTITGTVGTVYSIEYVTDLAQGIGTQEARHGHPREPTGGCDGRVGLACCWQHGQQRHNRCGEHAGAKGPAARRLIESCFHSS